MVDAVIRAAGLSALLALAAAGCPGPAGDAPPILPEIRLVQVFPLAGEDVPPPPELGSIADLEVGEDGSVYVLDGLERTVRVFASDGTPLRAFGRRGQGPGELEQPVALAWSPDGRLWVADPATGRFTAFDVTGEVAGTYVPSDPSMLWPLALGFSPEGLVRTVGLEFGRLEQPVFVLVEGEPEDGRIRERSRAELASIEPPAVFELRGDGLMMIQPVPFSPEPVVHVDPDGRIWHSSGGEPWVHRSSPDGGADQRIGREVDPPPVTPAERRAALEGEDLEELRRAAGPERFAEFSRLVPETRPPLQGFFFDDEGRVWVLLTPAEPGDAASPADVYHAGGERVAVARVPLEADPRPRVRNRLMAGVVRNGLGLESVAIFRLEWP